MTKEYYHFVLDMDKRIIHVDDRIYTPNGRKAVIEEITTVKKTVDGGIQIMGTASVE